MSNERSGLRRAYFRTWAAAHRFVWATRIAVRWDFLEVNMTEVRGGFKVTYP